MERDKAVSIAKSIINSILLTTFVVLRVSGAVKLSWWVVLAPIWIPIVYSLLIGVIAALIINFCGGEC